MAVTISLLLRNWISFLGKPECEETSINSNSQYKQVSRDTPEHKMYNPPHFIHMRHEFSIQQILAVYVGYMSPLYLAYDLAANTRVVCHFDGGFTLVKLALETVFTFALTKR